MRFRLGGAFWRSRTRKRSIQDLVGMIEDVSANVRISRNIAALLRHIPATRCFQPLSVCYIGAELQLGALGR